VSSLIRRSSFVRLSVYAKTILKGLKQGDSVSVNGVCLTVVDHGNNNFSVDISPESLKTSSLSLLKIGDRVNLERALLVGGRLGGHIVSGHVDGIAEVKGKIKRGEGIEMLVSVPKGFLKNIALRGSIAVEGVSLTVIKVTEAGFSVMLVPQTLQNTTLGSKNIGEKINFEVDMLSKYVERLVVGEPPTGMEKVMFDSGFLPIGIIDN